MESKIAIFNKIEYKILIVSADVALAKTANRIFQGK